MCAFLRRLPTSLRASPASIASRSIYPKARFWKIGCSRNGPICASLPVMPRRPILPTVRGWKACAFRQPARVRARRTLPSVVPACGASDCFLSAGRALSGSTQANMPIPSSMVNAALPSPRSFPYAKSCVRRTIRTKSSSNGSPTSFAIWPIHRGTAPVFSAYTKPWWIRISFRSKSWPRNAAFRSGRWRGSACGISAFRRACCYGGKD